MPPAMTWQRRCWKWRVIAMSRRSSLADRIIADSGDIDVCIVRPVIGRIVSPSTPRKRHPFAGKTGNEYAWVLGITLLLVTASYVLLPVTGYVLPAMVFLLAIMLSA